MKKAKTILMLSAVLMFVAGTALADWNPGDGHKMHFPQTPNLSDMGLDVLADMSPDGTYQKILADDWRCSQSGFVTDIHIWGSWLDDFKPVQPMFRLAIYSDIPASVSPNGHSVPGELLWVRDFDMGEYVERLYADGVYEEFFDPNLNEMIGFDTQVWQYNFYIDPAIEEAFWQEEGTIYWLSVTETLPLPGLGVFGWKTSNRHWNDDAVFTDMLDPTPLDWHELYDPRTGESLDLAFVITPEPGTMCLLVLGGIGVLIRKRRKA
jgi:hypothetical protein